MKGRGDEKVKYLLRKWNAFAAMLTASLILFLPISAMAAETETAPEYQITTQEISVDKESGEYSFEICIDTTENYAGAEFGVICSQGTEITSVSSSAESMTGPKEANGLVWFGFFAGEDSFSGEMVVKVEGSYEPGSESAIVIQDIKIYTVGDQDYTSTALEGGMIVNLNADSVTESMEDSAENGGINMIVLLAVFMVIVAAVAIVLIYRRKKRGEETNVFQENHK